MDEDAGAADLTAALAETLERTGALDDVRTRLRGAAFRCLAASLPDTDAEEVPHTPVPTENVLINEVIAEYLARAGYDQTLSVFVAESRTPTDRNGADADGAAGPWGGDDGVRVLGEAFVRAELGLAATAPAAGISLLHEIIEAVKGGRRK